MPAPYYGTIPANVSQNVNELFAGLLEFRWREVSFPVVEFSTVLRQDLAIHKFADRDGAHVEGTGRAPLQITARIPFLNGLDAGPNEHWQRPLYPYTWRKFFEACADKTSGTLQHPELGPLTCKVQDVQTRWTAAARSGVHVDVTWIESDDTGTDLEQALANPSPLANIQAAANDLDEQLTSVNPDVVPKPYVPPTSFGDLVNAIRGAVDQTTMLQKQFAGRIDNVLYEANALEFSLTAGSNANALNLPMVDACERAKSAAYDLKKTLLSKGKPIGFYTVQKDSTLAQIAASIPAPLGDVMQLNPGYIQSPVVPAGSVVRFYKSAA